MTGDSQPEVAVEAYTRPALLLEPVDAKIETLRDLADEDVLADLSVHSWPSEVAVSDHGLYDDVVETFETFETWADANDVDIRPPFSIRARESRFTGETATVLVTPVMCLAVYLDDRLAAVFPHSDEDVHHPVSEAIAVLRTGDLPVRRPVATERTPEPDPAEMADGCGSCGGPLVNVQGLLACHDCLDPVASLPDPTDRRTRLSHDVE